MLGGSPPPPVAVQEKLLSLDTQDAGPRNVPSPDFEVRSTRCNGLNGDLSGLEAAACSTGQAGLTSEMRPARWVALAPRLARLSGAHDDAFCRRRAK